MHDIVLSPLVNAKVIFLSITQIPFTHFLPLKIRKGLQVTTHPRLHARYSYIAKTLNPPSTTATEPVTNFAASLIR